MRRRKTDVGLSTIRDGRTRPIDVGVLAGYYYFCVCFNFLNKWK